MRPALYTLLLPPLRRLGLAGATGYILYFYSERVFWSFWRTDDSILTALMTWAVYSIVAEICLLAICAFKVRSLPALFIVGALLGWLVEGVFAGTIFGAGGIPFPITLSWTGLAWHGLISVMAGWVGMQLALLNSMRQTLMLNTALGVFWGLWSVSWPNAGAIASTVFLFHAVAATAGLLLAHRAYNALQASRVNPSHIEIWVLATLGLLYFCGVTVTRNGWLAVAVLPPLFILIFLALRRNKAVETRQDFLTLIDKPIPWLRTLALFMMPFIATAIHVASGMAAFSLPTNSIVLAITTPLGAIAFLVSVWKIFRRKTLLA
jgi:hypothetical protein